MLNDSKYNSKNSTRNKMAEKSVKLTSILLFQTRFYKKILLRSKSNLKFFSLESVKLSQTLNFILFARGVLALAYSNKNMLVVDKRIASFILSRIFHSLTFPILFYLQIENLLWNIKIEKVFLFRLARLGKKTSWKWSYFFQNFLVFYQD